MLEATKIINLNLNSIEAICECLGPNPTGEELHTTENFSKQFIILFNKIAQINIPIDTLEIIGFKYYEELLESNKEVLSNEKSQKVFARLISIFRPIDTKTNLKQKIEKACKSMKMPIKTLKMNIEMLKKELKPLQRQVMKVKRKIITLRIEGDQLEKRRQLHYRLLCVTSRFVNKTWLNRIKECIQMICINVEDVVTIHENLHTEIDNILPCEPEHERKIVMVSRARLQRVQTRLNTIADGVRIFVDNYEQTYQSRPMWMEQLVLLTTERTKIVDIFTIESTMITKKTANRLRLLLQSDSFTKKNNFNIISTMELYLKKFPKISFDLDIDYKKNVDNYYFDIYHKQFLLPMCDRFKFDVNDCMGMIIKKIVGAVKQANDELKSRIDAIENILKCDKIDKSLDKLEIALKNQENLDTNKRQEELQMIINEIKNEITTCSTVCPSENYKIEALMDEIEIFFKTEYSGQKYLLETLHEKLIT